MTLDGHDGTSVKQTRVQCAVCKTRVSLTFPVCPKCCPAYYAPKPSSKSDTLRRSSHSSVGGNILAGAVELEFDRHYSDDWNI